MGELKPKKRIGKYDWVRGRKMHIAGMTPHAIAKALGCHHKTVRFRLGIMKRSREGLNPEPVAKPQQPKKETKAAMPQGQILCGIIKSVLEQNGNMLQSDCVAQVLDRTLHKFARVEIVKAIQLFIDNGIVFRGENDYIKLIE